VARPNHPANPAIRLTDGCFYAADPHPHFLWMRENAPVFFDPEGQTWGVALYEDVMRVAKDPETFCNAEGMRPDSPPIPSMINMDDPAHKRRRNLVNKGFTPRRIAEHEDKVRGICADLIENARKRRSFDFVADVAAHLPMIMIGDMLGVEAEDRETLLRWSDDMLHGTSATARPEAMQAAMQAFEEYAIYNRRVVADRRSRPPQDDLMSILVHAEIDGERLDDEALLQESLLILIGGDETTRHVITGGMNQLLRHPDQKQKLIDDPRKIPTAIEEMLRWVTPIQNMARTATRDVELRGQKIEKGDKVLLLYPSANRDAAVFPNPFEFDVERRPNEHLAFGYGSHFCLGASLARLELRVMFEELLARLPNLRLVGEAPLEMRESNFITGIEQMPVTT
jgi:cytochrome P450 family 142 subfamily A polypeptide 1